MDIFKTGNTVNCISVAGITLLIVVFVLNPANVWLDEAALGVNVINKSFIDLLNPLEFNQVAPVGYLFIAKATCTILGYSDLTLRIPSILAMFFSLFLLLKLVDTKRGINLGPVAIFALGTWVYYGFELKQYIYDFLALTTFYYFIWKVQNRQLIWYSLLLILGWFSNIALTLIPFLFVFFCLVERQFVGRNLIFLLLTGANFLFYYFNFIYKHPHANLMKEYWLNYFFNLQSPFRWFFVFFKNLGNFNISGPNSYFNIIIFFVFVLILIFQMRYKKLTSIISRNYLLILPFVFAFILSLFRIYPLDGGRLSLYLAVPCILIFSKINVGDKLVLGVVNFRFILFLLFFSLTVFKVAYFKSFKPQEDIRPFIYLNNLNKKIIFTGSTIKHYKYYSSLGDLTPSNNLFYSSIEGITSLSGADCDTLILVEAHSKYIYSLPKRLSLTGTYFDLVDSNNYNGCRNKVYLIKNTD